MLAAAVLPHPPLLVPGVAAGAAGELAGLRGVCDGAVGAVLATHPDEVVVVGAGPTTDWFEEGASGSLRGFGVDASFALGSVGSGGIGAALPLSLTVGAWLLGRAAWDGPVAGVALAVGTEVASARAVGSALAGRAARVGLLVMGDGSARMSDRAPGFVDPRAAGFEASVATALAAGDPAALARLDPALAAELMVGGWVPWQVLAGAFGRGGAVGAGISARLLAQEAPYGVDYLVATWVAGAAA